MRTNALSPAGCWSIASNTIFECHFVCVHSYRHPAKNLLLQKLQYYKRGLGSTLLNMSQNAWVVIAVILVSSLSYSKSGKWLTWTKHSFFRSSIWKMRNSSEKVSFKRWVVCGKIRSMPSWILKFEAMKNNSLPSTIDVEQSLACSHRPLKWTYAIAGQFI